MRGDYSRLRFDPHNNYTGVNMQQGRVQLDADWNEWVDIIDRRTRAETVDTFGVFAMTGISGVAVVSPQTPGGFFIEAEIGNFTIGPGRMYVDGLLAENFGDMDGPQIFDQVLAELRGQNPLHYDEQPYHPSPSTLPGGGLHLVYLEVWQREVTHIQEPELVEIAVGVDTTTRSQTVWQVRLLDDIGSNISCSSPDAALSGWNDITATSAGRLSSLSVDVSSDTEPCELPPAGGYRGLENQLYRVEIHDQSVNGIATFKWSRDNGSVSAEVVEIVSDKELKLDSLGRDALLRFSDGDWVEILDDWRELSGENGDPARRIGLLRNITVNEKEKTISFTSALPADMIPTETADNTLEKRNFRVIRWDQRGEIRDADKNVIYNLDSPGSEGVIPVPGAGIWVHLENGLQVQFSLDSTGGSFHCNDYWNITARTNDSSVEKLVKAPPRGIYRHFTRLALVTFPGSETDCRKHWPPDCGGGCCTVIVEPGESIQQAIDSLPEEGGCVCLKVGLHTVTATITIMSPDIILCGEDPGAVIRSNNTLPALLQIGSDDTPVENVEIKDLSFEAYGETDGSYLLYLSHCRNVQIRRCALLARAETQGFYLGIEMQKCSDITLEENRFRDVYAGIQANDCRGILTVADNYISGLKGQYMDQKNSSLGEVGIKIRGGRIRVGRLENNILVHFWRGIFLSGDSWNCNVQNNYIYRKGGATDFSYPTNSTELRQYLDSRVYAIDVEVPYASIVGNFINLVTPQWGGIRTCGHHTTIKDNTLEAREKSHEKLLAPGGIFCFSETKKGLAADHSDIRNNTLVGVQTGIDLFGINGAKVENNFVDGSGNGWFGVRADNCFDTSVRNNDLRAVYFAINLSAGLANRIVSNRIDQAGVGVLSFQENFFEASNNTISSCPLFGIILFIGNNGLLIENRVVNCSYVNPLGLCLGIAVFAGNIYHYSEALCRIEGCEVLNTGVSSDGKLVSKVNAIGIGGLLPACRISHNRTGYLPADVLDLSREHRSLVLIGPLGAQKSVTHEGGLQNRFGSATITDNKFTGPGFSALVQIITISLNESLDFRFRDVTFSNNVCEHLSTNEDDGATVMLEGGAQIVMGNHINAGPGVFSIDLGNNPTTMMGNITSGNFLRHSHVLPTPTDQFNIHL